MFQTMRIGDWVIEADVEETRRQYANDIEDMCECLLCENDREVMKTLPREKAQMFEDFGLQPSVCTDINEFGQEGDRHLYVASYFIVGRILEGKKNGIRTVTGIYHLKCREMTALSPKDSRNRFSSLTA